MRTCKQLAAPIVIPNASHGMHRDNPQAFNSTVVDFLGAH
jgi:pimeloyl-ACP methyl ester carboxylesterase